MQQFRFKLFWTLLIVSVILIGFAVTTPAFGEFFWVQSADGTSKWLNARSLRFPNGTLSSDGKNNITYAPAATGLTGLLPVANGGLNVSTVPANGKIPIGNGTGYAIANITGTTNQIVVTNGSGTITLSTPQSIDATATPTFAALNISAGGSTTISTGVGSVRLSTANAATNVVWIPVKYAGVQYFVPGWTTNAP